MGSLKHVALVSAVFIAAVFLPMMLALAVLVPLLDVDPSTLQGMNFKITIANMLVVLSFSLTSVGIVVLAWRFAHKRPAMEMGWGGALWRDLAVGHALGLALAGLVFGVKVALLGPVTMSWVVPSDVSLAEFTGHYAFFWVALLTLNSLKEEVVFRAYPLEVLHGRMSMWPIIIITSVIFAAIHLALEPPTVFGFVGRLTFSVLACQVYLWKRSVWAAVGLHNGWNWFLLTLGGNWKLGGLMQVDGAATGWPPEAISVGLQVLAIVLFDRFVLAARIDKSTAAAAAS